MRIPDRTDILGPRVEMLPLIDVVFLVLVAFIYASMFMTQKSGLPVNLPKASQTESQPLDVITLTITKQGSLYLDQRKLSLKELEEALRAARIVKPDAALLLMADREAEVGQLVQVMDATRIAGIVELTIQAETATSAVAER